MPPRNDVLPSTFYERDVETVAVDLLGRDILLGTGTDRVGGRIVETEAYGGPGDPGSHADRAPGGRARIMFGPSGIAYVYLVYGMHHCLNAVTGPRGTASAVLIRALEPRWGLGIMRAARAPSALPDRSLASGPGRLCRSLGIDRTYNGVDLRGRGLRILTGAGHAGVERGRRVGLSRDDGREWRFWTDSVSVSRRRS